MVTSTSPEEKIEILKNKPKELLFITDIDTKSLCSLFIGQFLFISVTLIDGTFVANLLMHLDSYY